MNRQMVPQSSMPQVGTRQGDWVWDGARWVCSPCGDVDDSFPPFGPPVFSGPTAQPPWYPGANGGVSFGQTFPANPTRGHFFWDGTALWMFDGAAWVAVGGSAASGNTPPSTTPPANPQPGQQWFNGTQLFVWDGNAWVPVSQTKTTISATAPSAPHPGDLWFDGTQLRIWDGTAWELVGPGATVGPVPTMTQVFSLNSGPLTGVSTNYAALSILQFVSTPTIDSLSAWNPSTKQIKPNVAGLYLWVIRNTKDGDMGESAFAMSRNDTGVWDYQSTQIVAVQDDATPLGTGAYLQTTGVCHLNGTTDFVRLWGMSDIGTWRPISSTVPVCEGFLMP